MKLVKYYKKIRWLSVEQCVNRICHLYDNLREYFEKGSHDMNNSRRVRDRCQDLYEKVVNSKFVLYILFLKASLPVLADVN